MVCATSKASDQLAHTPSMIRAFAGCLNIQENYAPDLAPFVVFSLKGGCTGSYESAIVKMPHCWKSHVAAQYGIDLLASLHIEVELLSSITI